MATNTPILNLTLVAPNQNQKETTINTDFAIIEAALNDMIALDLSGGARSLTTDEFTKYFHQVYSGNTAATTATIPATVRFFAASNTGTQDVTLKCNGSSGTQLTLTAGKRVLALSDGTNIVAITSGVQHLADLTDVIGAEDASSGQLIGYDGTNWGPVDALADEAFYHKGVASNNENIHARLFTRNTRFLSDFTGSVGKALTATTAPSTFLVYKNATLVGNIIYSGTTATFTTNVGSGSTTVSFAPGDYMLIKAPASADATLADFFVTLKGVLI